MFYMDSQDTRRHDHAFAMADPRSRWEDSDQGDYGKEGDKGSGVNHGRE